MIRIPTSPSIFTIQYHYHTHSIADINQALVDDNLVEKEKIGGSNYFWSFPAKKDRMNQLAHEETLQKIESFKTNIKEAEARLADAKRGREEDESGERSKKMARRAELTKSLAQAQVELDKLKQNDPRELANLEKEYNLVKNGAHRWTDNIFSCKDYLVKKRGMVKKEGECFCFGFDDVCIINPQDLCALLIQHFSHGIYTANKYLGITDNFDCEFVYIVDLYWEIIILCRSVH